MARVEPRPALPARVAPAAPRSGLGPLERDGWLQVLADLERAVAPIRRDARCLGLPEHELDDVVQEALCRAWQKRGHYDRTRPLVPWLRGFGRRASQARLRALRRARRTDGLEAALGLQQNEPTPDECVALRERRDGVRALLRKAPRGYLDVLLARFRDGQRISAIAEARCETERAIERRLARAVTWLERSWLRRERGLPISRGRGNLGKSRGIPARGAERGGGSPFAPRAP